MISVTIIGFGNVGQHLFNAFLNADAVHIHQVYNRSEKPLEIIPKTINRTTQLSQLLPSDVSIIAVPDDQIATVSEILKLENCLVAHTSGSVPLGALSSRNRRSVFYPLQSFSKQVAVSFKDIPICIEAENKEDLLVLEKLGNAISQHVVTIDSKERETIHVAAVFVNNFVNQMYKISEDILKDKNLDFSLLKPLILETARKVMEQSPQEVQTGPAKRGDTNTMDKHIAMLDATVHREIYKLMSKQIQNQVQDNIIENGKKL